MTSFRIIRTSMFALAIAALVAFSSNQAQAQIAIHGPNGGGVHVGGGRVVVHGGGGQHGGGHWGGGQHGGGHWGGGQHGGGHWGGGQHGGGHWGGGHYGGIVNPPAHTWHDTSHYDYQPGGYVRHGNHFDYRPGQYTWHQQGHIDHNHR